MSKGAGYILLGGLIVVFPFVGFWYFDVPTKWPVIASSISLTANLATAIALIFASWTFRNSWLQFRRQKSYELISDYLNSEFKIAERYIKYTFQLHLKEGRFDFSEGLFSSEGQFVAIPPKDEQGHEKQYQINLLIQQVGNFYDRVGELAYTGIIDEEILFSFFGADVVLAWDNLEPVIKAHDLERRKRAPRYNMLTYQWGFYYLATRARQRNVQSNKPIYTRLPLPEVRSST